MMKKALVLVVASMAFASAASAAQYTAVGCGLGSMLFQNNTHKVELVLAATTNGTFGNQTFGISSDTLGCTSSGVAKADKAAEMYAAVNLQKLSQDMAKGGGEYLSGLAALMGCKTQAQRQAFFKLSQTRFERLLPSSGTDARALLANYRSEMAQDPQLRTL